MCHSFLWKTNSTIISGQASVLNLDIKIKVSFKSQNLEKVFLLLRPFSNDVKQKFSIECVTMRNNIVQFWSLLILCRKSVKNYPARTHEYLSPHTCYIASQGGKLKLFAKCIFFIICSYKSLPGKLLEGVEIE